MLHRCAILVLATFLGSRAACSTPHPVAPQYDAGPPPVFDGGDDCARVCRSLEDLGCEDGLRASCVDVCREHVAWKHEIYIDVDCITDAGTRDAAATCGGVCQ